VVRVRLGTQVVDDGHVWSVWSLFFSLLLTLAATAAVLAAFGLPPVSAIGAAAAALTNAGPAIAMVDPWAPSYASLPAGAQVWLAAAMILGRLELVTFFVLLNRSYWRA
jgi:trk system potassium uptake protein TrkH